MEVSVSGVGYIYGPMRELGLCGKDLIKNFLMGG